MLEKQISGAAAFAAERPELFIDGYFTARISEGKKPSHGYPTNHLPTVAAGASMEFVIEMGELRAN